MIIVTIALEGYTTSIFYCIGDIVYCKNADIGFFKSPMKYDDLAYHIHNMKAEGANIVIEKSAEIL